MYFKVNLNVFFKIKVHLLVSKLYILFGALARLRKVTVSFVMSIRLSVSPHGIPRLSLGGFSMKFDIGIFFYNCRENSIFITI